MRALNNILSTAISKIRSNFSKIFSTCPTDRLQKLFEKFASNFENLATKNIIQHSHYIILKEKNYVQN